MATTEPTLGEFCEACEAIPAGGYCHLFGCPMATPREYFADGKMLVCASEGGGVTIATASSPNMAAMLARAMNRYAESFS